MNIRIVISAVAQNVRNVLGGIAGQIGQARQQLNAYNTALRQYNQLTNAQRRRFGIQAPQFQGNTLGTFINGLTRIRTGLTNVAREAGGMSAGIRATSGALRLAGTTAFLVGGQFRTLGFGLTAVSALIQNFAPIIVRAVAALGPFSLILVQLVPQLLLVAGAVGGFAAAMAFIVAEGLKFNAHMERARISIAALSSEFSILERRGKDGIFRPITDTAEQLNASLALSAKQFRLLTQAAITSLNTTQDLLPGFIAVRSAVGGLNVTTTEAISLTASLAKTASVAGIPIAQYASSFTQVLRGIKNVRNPLQRFLEQVGLGRDEIVKLRQAASKPGSDGQFVKIITDRLKVFERAALLASNTLDGVISNLREALELFAGEALKLPGSEDSENNRTLGFYNKLRNALGGVRKDIEIINEQGKLETLTTFQGGIVQRLFNTQKIKGRNKETGEQLLVDTGIPEIAQKTGELLSEPFVKLRNFVFDFLDNVGTDFQSVVSAIGDAVLNLVDFLVRNREQILRIYEILKTVLTQTGELIINALEIFGISRDGAKTLNTIEVTLANIGVGIAYVRTFLVIIDAMLGSAAAWLDLLDAKVKRIGERIYAFIHNLPDDAVGARQLEESALARLDEAERRINGALGFVSQAEEQLRAAEKRAKDLAANPPSSRVDRSLAEDIRERAKLQAIAGDDAKRAAQDREKSLLSAQRAFAKALIEQDRQEVENRIDTIKQQLERQTTILEEHREQQLVAESDYFNERARIQILGFQAERGRLIQELAFQRAQTALEIQALEEERAREIAQATKEEAAGKPRTLRIESINKEADIKRRTLTIELQTKQSAITNQINQTEASILETVRRTNVERQAALRSQFQARLESAATLEVESEALTNYSQHLLLIARQADRLRQLTAEATRFDGLDGAARLAAITDEKDKRAALKRAADAKEERTVEERILEIRQARLNISLEDRRLALRDIELANEIEDVEFRLATGIIPSRREAEEEILILRESYRREVEGTLQALEREARIAGDQAKLNEVRQRRRELLQLLTVTDEVGLSINRDLRGTFSDFFDSITEGTDKALDSFRNLATGIVRIIRQAALQKLTEPLLNAMFGPADQEKGAPRGFGGFISRIIGRTPRNAQQAAADRGVRLPDQTTAAARVVPNLETTLLEFQRAGGWVDNIETTTSYVAESNATLHRIEGEVQKLNTPVVPDVAPRTETAGRPQTLQIIDPENVTIGSGQRFGAARRRAGGRIGTHAGTDFSFGPGQTEGGGVAVAVRGLVIKAEETKDRIGNLVEVFHGLDSAGQAVITRYGHLKDILVNVGDVVSENVRIGTIGNTGSGVNGPAFSPHLHQELTVGGVAKNLQDKRFREFQARLNRPGSPFSSVDITAEEQAALRRTIDPTGKFANTPSGGPTDPINVNVVSQTIPQTTPTGQSTALGTGAPSSASIAEQVSSPVTQAVNSSAATLRASVESVSGVVANRVIDLASQIQTGLNSLYTIASNINTTIANIGGRIESDIISIAQNVQLILNNLPTSTETGGANIDLGNIIGEIDEAASGGYVRGPGTSTSDSIFAKLSDGEFVVRADAVNKLGRSFLETLNAVDSQKKASQFRTQFRTGGLFAPTLDRRRALQMTVESNQARQITPQRMLELQREKESREGYKKFSEYFKDWADYVSGKGKYEKEEPAPKKPSRLGGILGALLPLGLSLLSGFMSGKKTVLDSRRITTEEGFQNFFGGARGGLVRRTAPRFFLGGLFKKLMPAGGLFGKGDSGGLLAMLSPLLGGLFGGGGGAGMSGILQLLQSFFISQVSAKKVSDPTHLKAGGLIRRFQQGGLFEGINPLAFAGLLGSVGGIGGILGGLFGKKGQKGKSALFGGLLTGGIGLIGALLGLLQRKRKRSKLNMALGGLVPRFARGGDLRARFKDELLPGTIVDGSKFVGTSGVNYDKAAVDRPSMKKGKWGIFKKILGFIAPFLNFIPGVGPILSQIAGLVAGFDKEKGIFGNILSAGMTILGGAGQKGGIFDFLSGGGKFGSQGGFLGRIFGAGSTRSIRNFFGAKNESFLEFIKRLQSGPVKTDIPTQLSSTLYRAKGGVARFATGGTPGFFDKYGAGIIAALTSLLGGLLAPREDVSDPNEARRLEKKLIERSKYVNELLRNPPRALAEGGGVKGKGSSSSDSILARLSNGEFVVRADAVRNIGINALNEINAGRLPKFAEGGMVGKNLPQIPEVKTGDTTVNTKIINAIDPNMIHQYMATPEGERVVLNIITRNPTAIRGIIGIKHK